MSDKNGCSHAYEGPEGGPFYCLRCGKQQGCHSKSEMKRVERMKDDRIKELEEKLKIVTKALKFYANRYHWSDDIDSGAKIVLSAGDGWNGYEEAEQALAKIKQGKL